MDVGELVNKLCVSQLQFSFMRDVNLQCYLGKQRQFFNDLYEQYRQEPLPFHNYHSSKNEFVIFAIQNGAAKTFCDMYSKHYFGEEDSIVKYDNR